MAVNHLKELHVLSHALATLKIRLQQFHWHLFTVHVQGDKICIVKFKAETVLSIIAAKSIIICQHNNNRLGQLSQKQIFLLAGMVAWLLC